jgi:hypothetical protein
MTLLEALADANLFAPYFSNKSWASWKVFLAAFTAAAPSPNDIEVFRRHTGRKTWPASPFTEAALVVGRRGGKSRILALIAVYLACFRSYSKYLAPGEVGTIAILAADRKQARVIFRFVRGLLKAVPLLEAMIVREDAEAITLNNRVVIEITTASFRSTRGYNYIPVLCVAAGTMIETEDGSRPIEDVREGDRVWTRDGLKRVLEAGMTHPAAVVYRVEFTDGRRLDATAEHPVFVRQKGFVPVYSLEVGDEVLPWRNVSTAAFRLAAEPRDASRARSSVRPGTAMSGRLRPMASGLSSGADSVGISTGRTGITAIARGNCSIVMSTWTSMVRYLRDLMFITKTRIRRTFPLAIWRSFRDLLISAGTGLEARSPGVPGTHGIALASMPCGPTVSPSGAFAFTAASPSSRQGCERSIAVRSVTRLSTRFPVYNLQVSGKPEYFANGILVHNCDEIAFWRSEESSLNPDKEILIAVRAGMGSIPGAVLLIASSPYAKQGELYYTFRRYYNQDDGFVLVWKATTLEMNPAFNRKTVAEAFEIDPEAAQAEYNAEFRSDLADYVTREIIDAVIVPDRHELPPQIGVAYEGFVDPGGGLVDSMTLSIVHRSPRDIGVVDFIYEKRAPFNPDDAVKECVAICRRYGVARLVSDRWGGEWARVRFAEHGIELIQSARPKSDLYHDVLPLLTSRRVELLDHVRMAAQFCSLERRTGRSGKRSITPRERTTISAMSSAALWSV